MHFRDTNPLSGVDEGGLAEGQHKSRKMLSSHRQNSYISHQIADQRMISSNNHFWRGSGCGLVIRIHNLHAVGSTPRKINDSVKKGIHPWVPRRSSCQQGSKLHCRPTQGIIMKNININWISLRIIREPRKAQQLTDPLKPQSVTPMQDQRLL